MAKKDFSKVMETITEATQETPTAQEVRRKNRPRKTYNAQEKQEFLSAMRTSGRKGVHVPRINVGFSPEVYDYVKVMSAASGLNMTAFINLILRDHMDEHRDLYEQAITFRNSL